MKTKISTIFDIFGDDKEPKHTEIHKDYDRNFIIDTDVSPHHDDLEKVGHEGDDSVTVKVHDDNEQFLAIDIDEKDKSLKAEIYKDDNEFLVEHGNEKEKSLRTEIY